MKKHFSKHWKSSRQTRKQRKYRANAPLHIRNKFIAGNLSKDLRKKYETRNIGVRKGDTVKIMRGEFKKRTGKITAVDLKREKIAIEGIQRKKKDGTKINVYFHPSNIQIVEIKEDKFRFSQPNKLTEQKQNAPDKK